MRNQIDIKIHQQSDVGDLRRQAVALARRGTNKETILGNIALVATELGHNILNHAGGPGQVLLRLNLDDNHASLDLLARDRGPGISQITRALEDGYSTGGTPGTGLGAVRRLSHQFDLYSRPGGGTVVFSRIHLTEHPDPSSLTVDGLQLPAPRETLCGDQFAIKRAAGYICALLVDALGHGPLAAECAERAVELFKPFAIDLPPEECCRLLHQGLRSSRGAALAVIQLDITARQLTFAGIGNIGGRAILPKNQRQLVSQPGIAGHVLPTVRCERLAFPPGSSLYLHSDGIVSRWSLEPYPKLACHHPLLQSAVLLRDFHRQGDDASMLIVHWSDS